MQCLVCFFKPWCLQAGGGVWTYVFSIGRGNNGPVTSWSEKPEAKNLNFTKMLQWVGDKLAVSH